MPFTWVEPNPTVGADDNTWGTKLNDALDEIRTNADDLDDRADSLRTDLGLPAAAAGSGSAFARIKSLEEQATAAQYTSLASGRYYRPPTCEGNSLVVPAIGPDVNRHYIQPFRHRGVFNRAAYAGLVGNIGTITLYNGAGEGVAMYAFSFSSAVEGDLTDMSGGGISGVEVDHDMWLGIHFTSITQMINTRGFQHFKSGEFGSAEVPTVTGSSDVLNARDPPLPMLMKVVGSSNPTSLTSGYTAVGLGTHNFAIDVALKTA